MKKRIYFSLFLVFMLLLSPSVHAQSDTKIGIPIQITTNGSQTTGQVTLSSEDSSAPMPNENPVTIQGKDNIVLSYTKTGTWKYTIKQIAGSDQDTTYDTTLYHLTVFIGYKDGGLYSVVTLFKDGSADKDAEVVFANTKKEKQETPVTPPSNKEETPKKETPVNNKKITTEKKKTNKKKIIMAKIRIRRVLHQKMGLMILKTIKMATTMMVVPRDQAMMSMAPKREVMEIRPHQQVKMVIIIREQKV